MSHFEFWQALLSLDLPPHKARVVLERLGPDCRTLSGLAASCALTPEQRARVTSPPHQAIPKNTELIAMDDARFPLNLRTANPPPALFFRGSEFEVPEMSVAIVGTRKASPYGKTVAKKIASELAANGVTIVSGGAYGIDAAAHEGALEAAGKTFAVMGCGVDSPYPKSNRGLFEKIMERGALISQFALGTGPDWWRFPMRNDTIVGLSRAVIVVEAPERSGALTTASSAADHGRHMFVTPANIDSLNHRGSFGLINDGATLLYSPDQVFQALGIDKRVGKVDRPALSKQQEQIITLLSNEPEIADVIAEKLRLDAGPLLGELTQLELLGYIAKTPGGYVLN